MTSYPIQSIQPSYQNRSITSVPPAPNDVGGRSLAYQKMATHWELITDLLGGTIGMQLAAQKWLPKEEHEKDEPYRRRLLNSVLDSMLESAIDAVASKPFAETVKLRGKSIPDWIQETVDDMDLSGRGITEYAFDLFKDGVTYGHSVQMIDAPATGGELNLAEERAAGVRPYSSILCAPSIIGWRSATYQGEEITTQLRVVSVACEPDGLYGEKLVESTTVYTPGAFVVYARPLSASSTANDWKEIARGPISYPVEWGVPIAPFYVKRTGFLTSEPPFEELAWTNLAHFRSDSDQRNILRFARVGTLVIAGVTPEEKDTGVDLGPRNSIISTNTDIKAFYAEHSGAAITCGERDLKALEERARRQSMEPMTVGSAERTVTEVSVGEGRTLAAVQSWIRRLEYALRQAIVIAGRWKNETVPDDFAFDVFSDFVVSGRASEDMQTLITLNTMGKLQDRTLLEETKRRGILAEAVDIDAEVDAAANMAPDFPAPGDPNADPATGGYPPKKKPAMTAA